MVAEFFTRDGWIAQHARPATIDDLVAEVRATAPAVLGLSIGRSSDLPLLRQTIAAIRRAMRRGAPAMLIGGAALTVDPELIGRSGANGHALDAASALRVASGLVDERANAFPDARSGQPPRKDRFVGLPIPRRRVSGLESASHRTTGRGRG